jgi:thiosulfate/3-mercaptopyruvate sulfurtransferase
MFHPFRTALFATLAALAPLTAVALGLPGPQVSAAWLQQHRAEVNVLDVREDPATFTKAPTFTTEDGKKVVASFGGHIPGALLLDFADARTTRKVDGRDLQWMLPDQAAFQALMRRIGVQAGRPTVIVSDGNTEGDLDMAARVYWSMKIYGDDNLTILDGGTAGWLAAGLPVSVDGPKAAAGTWVAGPERRALFADSQDVAAAASHGQQLVDARPLPFYMGLARKPAVLAAGHIKSATNFPGEVRAVKRDGGMRFLSGAEYAAIFSHLRIDPRKPTITYCNTGHLASGAWFVLHEIMHNPKVAVYDGSMYEWTVEKRPVVALP